MKQTLQLHVSALMAMIGVALGLAFIWVGWVPKPLYANGPCQRPTFNFVGTSFDTAVAVYGASVDLNSRQPLLCNGVNTTSASAVWGEIASNTNCGWAQVGYVKFPKLAIKVYSEYNQQDCVITNQSVYKLVVWGTGQNGTHTYQVRFKPGKHLARFWYDSFPIGVTPFDPGAAWGPQPWGRKWTGETHDNGDDMPGSAASPVFFTNLRYMNCAACAWVDPGIPANVNDLPARYGLQQDAGSSFRIWTK